MRTASVDSNRLRLTMAVLAGSRVRRPLSNQHRVASTMADWWTFLPRVTRQVPLPEVSKRPEIPL